MEVEQFIMVNAGCSKNWILSQSLELASRIFRCAEPVDSSPI
jgi:hypothetical protein